MYLISAFAIGCFECDSIEKIICIIKFSSINLSNNIFLLK